MASVPTAPPPTDGTEAQFLEHLAEFGWAIIVGFLSAEFTQRLHQEAMQSDSWASAGIGATGQTNGLIRRDKTLWLTGSTVNQAQYLAQMEALRLLVNQHFFAGLFEYEAHFSHYAKGAFYKKHRDALQHTDARVLSSVCYLNAHWQEQDGGELIIYNAADTHIEARIAPIGGNLIVFWSEDFPHEVVPALRDRFSIAGWFRRNLETSNPL